MGPIDLIIIGLYFVMVLGIGLYLKSFTKTGDDFFLAGRDMSAWVAGLSFVAANLGSLELMGWAGSAYQYGILAAHWYWIGAILLPGKALFFDPMRDRNCGVCHRVAGSGTEVAPLFAGGQILRQQTTSQPDSAQNTEVSLRDGEEFCGIEASEDQKTLRIYDMGGTGPPVLRTLSKSEILSQTGCAEFNAHRDNTTVYTAEELAEIEAFLEAALKRK